MDLVSAQRGAAAQHGDSAQTLPPALPSEFQKFVTATTGQSLEIYGDSLFRNVPASFSSSNLTPASANYVIGPDDELRIRIWGAINYSGNLRVDRSGNIYLPQIGLVHVGGLHFSELDSHLRTAAARVYRNFDLSAELGRIRSIQVYVTGQANKPGVYTVSALSSLVDAIFASGGPSPQGSLRHIELKRDGKVVTDFDLYALLLHGDKSKDAHLQPEDVLYIPPVGPQVAVLGSIRNPAIYELRGDETIGDLFAIAGGTSALAARTKISLDRQDQNQRRAVDFSVDSNGLSVRLADSDIVRVSAILPAYQKTVTLRGSIANAGHYGWHDGMRLSDLIPDRDFLMSRDYWWKRNHLGLPSPDFEPEVTPATSMENTLQNLVSGPEGLPAGNKNADRALQNTTSREATPIPRNDVHIVAPELNWNYAVIERVDQQTLKTSLVPFDLGKLVLQHDSSQDLALQPGDTVTIFSQKDIRVPVEQQTKYVTLEGEVAYAGTYSVLPGETLRSLVKRAGGLTKNSYLYASQLTRRSTRQAEEEQLKISINRMQQELLARSASAPSTTSEAALTQQAAIANQRALIASLASIHPTGRIVLKMAPHANSIANIPDFPLEDGDNFFIPSQLHTVHISGEVYNPNAFIYQPRKTLSAYLEDAGGPNRDADAKRIYVIRADGRVVTKRSHEHFWSHGLSNLPLLPGDAIIVPAKMRSFGGFWQQLPYVTQMISQTAMTGAVVAAVQ